MKTGSVFAAILLVGVLVLGGVLLVLHSQNDRRFKDCLTNHGIVSKYTVAFNPCHKDWP